MFRRLSMLKHFEALRRVYLFSQGDLLSLFQESVFNDDFESTVKENALSFINAQFELAVRLSYPEGAEECKEFSVQRISEVFMFQARDLSS